MHAPITMDSVTVISITRSKLNWIPGLLLMLALASYVSTEYYLIVPNDSYNGHAQCRSYSPGTCFTLTGFASNISHLHLGITNNLTLSLLPGEHLLTRRLVITGPQNIVLTGQNSSNSSVCMIKCQGTSGFEFGDIKNLNIAYLEFIGCGNVSHGGAISINRVDMFLIKACRFIANHVTWNGGAIFVNHTVAMNIEASSFNYNYAFSDDSFLPIGGAIGVFNGSIFTTNSIYMVNSAYYSGAIYTWNGNICSINDHYINNSAVAGGAINVTSGNIYSTSDHYINNSALYSGGAIEIESGSISSTSNHYTNNTAKHGGAIYVYTASDHYINNSARTGGAILMDEKSAQNKFSMILYKDSFSINTAEEGAVIFKTGGLLDIGQTNITDNAATKIDVLYLHTVTLLIAERVNSINNRGSLYVVSTQVQINGVAAFMNNLGVFGGAVTAIQQSQLILNTDSAVTICNNTATYGGGIYLAQSNLQVNHPFELMDNKAREFGGGIYASRSEIEFT